MVPKPDITCPIEICICDSCNRLRKVVPLISFYKRIFVRWFVILIVLFTITVSGGTTWITRFIFAWFCMFTVYANNHWTKLKWRNWISFYGPKYVYQVINWKTEIKVSKSIQSILSIMSDVIKPYLLSRILMNIKIKYGIVW